ncbi:MAG: hypothetical protein II857_08065 [Selenomonadaceae bacterium]|nr:hypothetical protein [Selenomonadaceae bacterium]
MKNLRNKDYNPCGDLTGSERELCDEAAKNYFNLPFVEVMRAISIKAIAELEHEENFRNVDALKNWAGYNLNEVERRANLNFDTFTPLQAGLCKYLVHVLYENRYNIHYNALANYSRTLDEKVFPAALTADEFERKINSLVQEANYFSRVNDLISDLWKILAA